MFCAIIYLFIHFCSQNQTSVYLFALCSVEPHIDFSVRKLILKNVKCLTWKIRNVWQEYPSLSCSLRPSDAVFVSCTAAKCRGTKMFR